MIYLNFSRNFYLLPAISKYIYLTELFLKIKIVTRQKFTTKENTGGCWFTPVIFFVTIFMLKRESLATWSWELLGNFSKKLPHFKEESYEIAKTFEEFGQIFLAFRLLKSPYLANRF
jgi:hypothetical protein